MHSIAIFDPLSLAGQEIRRTLEARHHLWRELKLLSTDPEQHGGLTEVDGGAAMVSAYGEGELDGVDLVLSPGAEYETFAADVSPATRLVLLERGPEELPPAVHGVNQGRLDPSAGRFVSPDPAVVVLAHLLEPLAHLGLRGAWATVVYPVSSLGGPALDELFEQTRALLNFQPNPVTPHIGHQMAFNLVPSTAEPGALASQLRAVLDRDLDVAIAPLVGGIFHSLSVSLFVELGEDPGAEEVGRLWGESEQIALIEEADRLGPTDAADRDEVLVTDPVAAGRPGTYRVWAVADNLTRGVAANAVDLAEWLLTG